MIQSLGLLIAIAAAAEVNFEIKPGIESGAAEFNCKYKLGDENLLYVNIFKGTTQDEAKNPIIFVRPNASNSTPWKNKKSDLYSRLEFETNEDIDDWRIATVRITGVKVEDKGDYSCGVTTDTADNPAPNTVRKTATFDVYTPPTTISFSPTFGADGSMTARCEIDAAYPDPEFSISTTSSLDITLDPMQKEENAIFRTFQYPISPSVNNEKFSCQVSHDALDSQLESSFQLSAPLLPNSGEMIDELVMGEYTLSNAAMLLDPLAFSNATENGVLTITDSEITSENTTCKVSMTAFVGTLVPEAKLVWFVDGEKSADGQSYSLETSKDGNDTLLTVIADSLTGRVALQFNYRESCFPTLASTVSIETTFVAELDTIKPDMVMAMSELTTVPNNNSDESVPEGSGFSHDDDVDGVQMSGAIIASIVASTIAIILLIGAIIYFLCFAQKSKTVYRPNDKGGDSGPSEVDDLTASIDMNDVVHAQSGASVQRTLSGTWHKPSEEASLLQVNNNSNNPRRTVSTQTLEGHVDIVTLKETKDPVYGSTRSVHV